MIREVFMKIAGMPCEASAWNNESEAVAGGGLQDRIRGRCREGSKIVEIIGVMNNKFYAHSLPDQPPEKWQPLEEHLKNVAELVRKFAEPFGAGDWAYLAGLWHDLGF